MHRKPLRLTAVLCCLWTLLLWAAPVGMAAPLQLVHPPVESGSDDRPDYPIAVLRLAMDRSGVPYTLRSSATAMQQSRSLRLLAAGEELRVAWSATTIERERTLRAVRFPIDRGLLGWRVLLIRRGDEARFAGMVGAPSLGRLRTAQGHDWPDLDILRANGLRVDASATYEGLFEMLSRGHIDFLPRAVTEAGSELRRHPQLGLVIEPGLLLHYPMPLYFFVRPGDETLALALERGLEAGLADGSFLALWQAHHAGFIASLGLSRRRVVRLVNAGLPAETPIQRRELWFEPGDP